MAQMTKRKKKNEQAEARADDYKLILAPVLTEKTSMMGKAGEVVAFRVDRRASKTDIKDAIRRIFKVEVADVRTMRYSGKPKNVGRSTGFRKDYKKAYVTLKEGQRIDIVEGL